MCLIEPVVRNVHRISSNICLLNFCYRFLQFLIKVLYSELNVFLFHCIAITIIIITDL